MNLIVSLFTGVLFGAGLAISGMVDPARVLGFLDVTGGWDPTLAFVMGGALLVTVPGFYFLLKRERPLLCSGFELPVKQHIDSRLVTGALMFGAGWGLAGLCPGPALVNLTSGILPIYLFVLAMIVGMLVFRFAPVNNS